MNANGKAHDLRDEAHTPTAHAAIKGGPPVGNEVQSLLTEARSPLTRRRWAKRNTALAFLSTSFKS
jgi:hypothetical protein